jgi:hypothetical protein
VNCSIETSKRERETCSIVLAAQNRWCNGAVHTGFFLSEVDEDRAPDNDCPSDLLGNAYAHSHPSVCNISISPNIGISGY